MDLTGVFFKIKALLMRKEQTNFNTLKPRQNGRHFADDTFKRIFMDENIRISIKISLKSVSKGRINNIPALVPITHWRRLGNKPLSEPMMVGLLTHLCVTRPQWVLMDPIRFLTIRGLKGRKPRVSTLYSQSFGQLWTCQLNVYEKVFHICCC